MRTTRQRQSVRHSNGERNSTGFGGTIIHIYIHTYICTYEPKKTLEKVRQGEGLCLLLKSGTKHCMPLFENNLLHIKKCTMHANDFKLSQTHTHTHKRTEKVTSPPPRLIPLCHQSPTSPHRYAWIPRQTARQLATPSCL